MRAYKHNTAPAARKVVFAHDANEFGGMEVYLLRLINHLDPARYTPALLVPGFEDEFRASPERLLQRAEALDVPVLRPPDPGDRFGARSLKEILNIMRLLKAHQADLVHIHTCRAEGARKVTVAARLAGVPAVVRTEHMPPRVNVNMTSRSRFVVKPFDWLTDYIVTGSEGDREAQIEMLGRAPEKVVRAYNSVDAGRFDPDHDVREAKEQIGLDPKIPTVGTVGRLAKVKGHRYLLDATQEVVRRNGPVNVLLVGDGALRRRLKKRADRLGIRPFVHFAGFQADVRPYMHAMDIAVMPSLWEVFSLAMLEFMALGKPVVASDHSSFQEALVPGRSGLLVPRKDSEALAEAICYLLNHPNERARLGQAALERVHAHFGLDRLANEMMSLYDLALSD